MNILIIQENGRQEASKHMRECFSLKHSFENLGHKATCWGLGHKSYEENKSLYLSNDFDLVFCLENYDNGWMPDDLNKTAAIKVFWSIDSHCALREHVSFCQKFNPQLFLSSSPVYLNHYQGISEQQHWFPNAVDTRWFRNKNMDISKDIVFAASPIADRLQVSEFLNKIVGLELISDRTGEGYVDLLNSTKVSFNKSISDDINYRIFETLACKTPLVTNLVPGLDQLLIPDADFASYDSNNPKEMVGVCQWLLKDKTARDQLAANGHEKVLKFHTYDARAEYFFSLIDGI